jgi:hypothetical protein
VRAPCAVPCCTRNCCVIVCLWMCALTDRCAHRVVLGAHKPHAVHMLPDCMHVQQVCSHSVCTDTCAAVLPSTCMLVCRMPRSFGPNLGPGANSFSPDGIPAELLGEASPNKVCVCVDTGCLNQGVWVCVDPQPMACGSQHLTSCASSWYKHGAHEPVHASACSCAPQRVHVVMAKKRHQVQHEAVC